MDQTVIPQLRITDAARSRAFSIDGLDFACHAQFAARGIVADAPPADTPWDGSNSR